MNHQSKQGTARATGTIDETIAARIKCRRKVLNISIFELASQLGVSCQQLQKYENAQNRVSASRLGEISTLLRVPIGYFYGDQSDADEYIGSSSSIAESDSIDPSELENSPGSAMGGNEEAFAVDYDQAATLYLELSRRDQKLMIDLLQRISSKASPA